VASELPPIPPNNLEAERDLLGNVLLQPELLARVRGCITPDEFFKHGHGAIFAAMLRLDSDGEPVDTVTITEELRRRGELDEVEGQAALARMMEEAGVATQAEAYCRIVRDLAAKRALLNISRTVQAMAADGNGAEEILRHWEVETAKLPGRGPAGMLVGPWSRAVPAPEFLAATDAERAFYEENLLAPGSVTQLFSPRGLGKTHVAHAIAARQARLGRRVLILDRDNSRREVKRRLRAWGAAETPTLRVLTRDQVPPLTERDAWRTFPFRDYDVVVIDSIDSSTEGVGEQDSRRPSQAIAPLLDIAHREDGPAILMLGNTIKSAEHSRGSGVVEDRADVTYEVRDATDLQPTGTKPWWQELPAAGAGAWAERAARRKRRDTYRLAFVCTKFRVGEEPDPFVLEVDLSGEPWRLRDVTAEMQATGEATRTASEQARLQQREAGTAALRAEVIQRAAAGDPMLARTDAEPFLMERGLSRKTAREVIADGEGRDWQLLTRDGERGRPKALLPIIDRLPHPGSYNETGQNDGASQSSHWERGADASILAGQSGSGRPESGDTIPALDATIADRADSGRPPSDTPVEVLEW
jgi:hypothetical protein